MNKHGEDVLLGNELHNNLGHLISVHLSMVAAAL